ncbi:MAG TPA: LacI family DNA-binding transcriptional regulator [Solirubrobacteraceae bacterium]|nr:LacI family DNA-binding transcriptional regulator [Solirubrobacteraceae bacterium]
MEAGVSITTVSHVFSGKRQVSEETRRRVLAVAELLDYKPRASARALATGRSMTIAVQHWLSGPEYALSPFFGAMLTSMSEAAIGAGYSFIFVPADPSPDVFVTPLIGERRIDGAILIDPVPGDVFVDAVIEHKLPTVSMGRVEGHPEKLTVDHDHARALAGVLEHLGSQGYERPAMLSLVAETSYVADMGAAFERLTAAGSPLLAAAEFSERSGYELGLELLEAPDRPDAIFCVNDVLAVGVARAASERGLIVPDELGIVGVGDSPFARDAPVPLTSVRLFPERAGRLLLELLEAVLAGGEHEPDSPDPIPTELVVRASTVRR